MRRSLRMLRPLLLLSLCALTSACGLLANEFMTFDGAAPMLLQPPDPQPGQ